MACADVDMDIHGSDEPPPLPGQRRTMACADVDMDIHGSDEAPPLPGQRHPPLIRYYQATDLLPDKEGPLHPLLQKQPAVLGSLQMVSGLLSVGLGIHFAATLEMNSSLFTLFRVSHMTGTLFTIAGVVTNLLFKYPRLLRVSFVLNCGCIIVAVLAACLITVDLALWGYYNPYYDPYEQYRKMEVLGLCVLGFEVILSAVLCFWFSCQITKINSE